MPDNAALSDFSLAFLSSLLEGVPFIVLGTLFSGFIDAFLSPSLLTRFLPKNKALAILAAGMMGLFLPVCECAVVPVIRRLIGKGLPLGCAFAYLLAAPIVNPISLFSTYKAFGDSTTMMLSRGVIGYLVAILAAWIISALPIQKVLTDVILASKNAVFHDHGKNGKWRHALRSSQSDFVDVLIYFTLGVAITSLFNTRLAPSASFMQELSSSTLGGPLTMMGLAVVLSVCSSTDAFIAAPMHYFQLNAKLAFLVLGPMLDFKLFFLYQTLMKRRFLISFSAGLILAVLGFCLLWPTFSLTAN